MRLVLLLLTVLGVSRSAASQPPPPKPEDAVIRLDSATSARVCADCSPREVRFGVTALSGTELAIDPSTEKPLVAEVSVGGTRDAAAERSFEARWEVGEKKTPRALVLTVRPELRAQGTYAVVLNVLPNLRPLAPRVTLQIVVPAARLRLPAKLAIERTIYPLSVETEPQTIGIREIGRVSSIQALSWDPPQLMAGSESVTGRIAITRVQTSRPAGGAARPDGTVAADQPATLTIAADGDFPLGVASGQLRLSAPELAEEVLLPVEVRSRLSRQYLFAAIVVGIVLSWWLKVFTHGIIERNTARAAAVTLLRRVHADVGRYEDAVFRNGLTQPINDLEAARLGSDAAAMEKARTALETKWRDLVADLDKRRTELTQSLAEFEELLGRAWKLPVWVEADLDTAKTQIREAAARRLSDVDGASTALTTARLALVTALQEKAASWQTDARRLFDEVVPQIEGSFAAIGAALKASVAAWRAKFQEFPQTPVKADPTKLEDLLQRLDGEYRQAEASITGAMKGVASEMEKVPFIGPSVFEPVRTELDRVEKLWRDALDDPADALSKVAPALQRFDTAWEHAKASVASGSGSGVLLGGGGGPATVIEPFPAASNTPQRGSMGFASGAPSAPDPYGSEIADLESTVWRAKLQQSVIVGLLFMVWAAATYSPTFDGTWPGLATVFFSAFSADVAVDSLLSKMKR